jgi:hypothetical protein
MGRKDYMARQEIRPGRKYQACSLVSLPPLLRSTSILLETDVSNNLLLGFTS